MEKLKSEKSLSERYAMRRLKVKEEERQHRFPRRFHNKTKNRVSVSIVAQRRMEWRASEMPCVFLLCSGEFLRKEAWTGPELPKVKEDLTFCLDINGTALTPRGLNVAESEG